MTKQEIGISKEVSHEQIGRLKADYSGYLEETGRLLQEENPQLNKAAEMFYGHSFSFMRNRILARHMYNLIRETAKGKIPIVGREVFDSEMAKFRENPIHYSLSRLNDYMQAEDKCGRDMDFTYIGVLHGSMPKYSFNDGLAISALYLGMLKSQLAKDKGLKTNGNGSAIVGPVDRIEGLESLCHENPHLGDLILSFGNKSFQREKVLKTGVDICAKFGNLPFIDEEVIDNVRKEFRIVDEDFDHGRRYARTQLQRLSFLKPEIFHLICERALPKVPKGKTPEQMVDLFLQEDAAFWQDDAAYYGEMDAAGLVEEAKEEAFKILHKKYRGLFIYGAGKMRQGKETFNDEDIDIVAEYGRTFEKSSPEVIGNALKELLTKPEGRKIFRVMKKYPEEFKYSIDFFSKYRKLSKMYDLEKAFEGKYQYKLLGNLAPVEEVLMLGASIGHIVGGGAIK